MEFSNYWTVCANIAEDKFKECTTFKKLTAGTKTPAEWSEMTAIV